jgi:hypothetical protein
MCDDDVSDAGDSICPDALDADDAGDSICPEALDAE